MYVTKKEQLAISEAIDMISTAMHSGGEYFIKSYSPTLAQLQKLNKKPLYEIHKRKSNKHG